MELAVECDGRRHPFHAGLNHLEDPQYTGREKSVSEGKADGETEPQVRSVRWSTSIHQGVQEGVLQPIQERQSGTHSQAQIHRPDKQQHRGEAERNRQGAREGDEGYEGRYDR